MIKNLLFSILYFTIYILILTLILTIFNYINIIPLKIIKILKFLIPLSGIIIASYILGKKSQKKGYLEGLKLGTIITLLFLIISLISKTFTLKNLIYYSILILTSSLSSMIGINLVKTKQ